MDGMDDVFLFVTVDTVLFVLDNDNTGETGLAQLLQIAFQSVFGKPGHQNRFAFHGDFFLLADVHLANLREGDDFASGNFIIRGFESIDFVKRPDHHQNNMVKEQLF